MLKALAPKYGVILVEGMIGNRPISIIKLNEPIECRGFSIACVEIPSPKEGSPYPEGLEHAEFVIGEANDDPSDNRLLKQMIETYSSIKFDTRAINKDINADISLQVDDTSIKFHVRPIYEIVEIERKNNLVVKVPDGYFD
jgi:predicted metalloenzyme YecM